MDDIKTKEPLWQKILVVVILTAFIIGSSTAIIQLFREVQHAIHLSTGNLILLMVTIFIVPFMIMAIGVLLYAWCSAVSNLFKR